ncbi:hypothetical protein ACWGST_04110 [Agromyces sp. NPDC055520]
MISDIAFDGADVHVASAGERTLGREGGLVMVNGQVGATLIARPGERQRWRIINACSSRYLRLRLDGQRMQLLGVDTGRYAEPQDVDEIVLAPGNRADVMMTAVRGDQRASGTAVRSRQHWGCSGVPQVRRLAQTSSLWWWRVSRSPLPHSLFRSRRRGTSAPSR